MQLVVVVSQDKLPDAYMIEVEDLADGTRSKYRIISPAYPPGTIFLIRDIDQDGGNQNGNRERAICITAGRKSH